MTAAEAYRKTKQQLAKAGIENPGFEADLLLQRVAGFSRFSEGALDAAGSEALQALALRRTAHEPLQYLLGSWPFMGLQLEVGPGVLCPRPETEEVCLAAVDALKDTGAPTVLDLCAGSGALALGIQNARPDAVVAAVEYSPDAFAYCARNCTAFADAHGGNTPHAIQADALAYHETLQSNSLDLLVGNPPYVTEEEYQHLAPELYHEPREALVAGEGGLLFYDRIARHYLPKMKAGGHIVFEIGATQSAAVCGILSNYGWHNATAQQDLAGNARIVSAVK